MFDLTICITRSMCVSIYQLRKKNSKQVRAATGIFFNLYKREHVLIKKMVKWQSIDLKQVRNLL